MIEKLLEQILREIAQLKKEVEDLKQVTGDITEINIGDALPSSGYNNQLFIYKNKSQASLFIYNTNNNVNVGSWLQVN